MSPPNAKRRPGLLTTTLVLMRKDLLIEWRTRARLNALVFFAMATLLLFSFALGPDTKLLERNAGGYLWLAILFASVLSLGESFRVETENACLDGVRLAPADARAIFLSKALGNALLLLALSVVLVPVMVALYGVRIVTGVGDLAGILVLGSMALSAPGTVYAAISSNARARDVLLPLLLFPLVIPALLSAAKGTTLVLQGDPMQQLGSWQGLLLGFNLIYWGVGFLLFPRVIED
ncbi:heme exporter protein CcmB [Corallococcus exiguus]|uniref:heme exporter protein CcmB n=1 Tax=Corallococcus TaxID=83461 RepID=UPI000EA27FB9|nr:MULTISPECIES: heme exporter protein CcmB [Corallococcus]NNC20027.1 ABC transporter permease [Corallococcus exiguus]NRD57413.1 heme exporter protein CcmB [Corallococcus exiguus]NRD64243.1 heme exporter protein CcmB [Corallococcus exiguus]RKH24004.1 transcriptional regulator [Corallococcus sp. CA041A]RKI18542.1 transcriptional regulator [Corallococcus sp. AB030]